MYQFIESIYWKNEKMPLIHWHEIRFKETQLQHFGAILYPSLQLFIKKNVPKDWILDQVYKIRIIYSERYIAIDFQPYVKKIINHLYMVKNDHIDYSFKYLDRADLDQLKVQCLTQEEVIIVKNGFLTDTTFTNIALYKGQKWETPLKPLLEGTQRSQLIEEGIISPKSIQLSDLHQYSHIRLFNAMVNWDESWELPIHLISM